MMTGPFKQLAHELVESLADDSGWDDLLYTIHVRQKLDRARDDSAAGRVLSHEQILAEFGIRP
jgi:hypothetical protein